MTTKRKRYEVLGGDTWYACKKAELQGSGWLHYETYDGTIGLAPPGKWREKVKEVVNG